MKLKSFLFLSLICLLAVVNSKVNSKDIELLGELESGTDLLEVTKAITNGCVYGDSFIE